MRKLISFEDWEAERMRDPEYVTAAEEHEPANQIARLRVMRGLTQEQPAEEPGSPQNSASCSASSAR